MSLFYRRKSAFFNNSDKTCQKLKIEQLLNAHKIKLNINNRTSSKPKPHQIQKLSLAQALKIENLHQTTASSRRSSMNSLFKGFDNNAALNIEEGYNSISDERMKLFREGIYYRSIQRAKGAEVNATQLNNLEQYFQNKEEIRDQIEKISATNFSERIGKTSRYKLARNNSSKY